MPKLSPVAEKFILHWGEMGTRWGINRTVAQIHALLYLSPQPLHAEEIAQTLSVARSNVSTSLRELQGWGIVRVAHVQVIGQAPPRQRRERQAAPAENVEDRHERGHGEHHEEDDRRAEEWRAAVAVGH